MASSTRIKGTKLALKLGTPATDVWADITSYSLEPKEADSDTTTFWDASQGGGVDWLLKLSGIQSLDQGSFWMLAWKQSGQEVPYTLAPFGNETPTASEPHFAGTVRIGMKPKLGGEAGNAAFTFDVEWKATGEPTMISA